MVDARDELVNYIDRLTTILDQTLHMKSVRGSTMAAHMLNVIVTSITTIQSTEFQSINIPFKPVKEHLTIRCFVFERNLVIY